MSDTADVDRGRAPAPRLSSLDTLRGIAITMVIVFHASVPFELSPWVHRVTALGNQGVQLFFLISAFTMCLMWSERAGEPSRTGAFYIRRFLRIAPLYWLSIAIYLAREHWAGLPPSTPHQVWANAFFVHGFSPSAINSTVPGGWSIGVEMSFYAVFPLMAVLRLEPLKLLLLALASYLVLSLAVAGLQAAGIELPPLFVYYSQLTQFPIFPLGMLVFALSVRPRRSDLRWLAVLASAWLVFAFAAKFALSWNTRPFFWLQVFLFCGLVFAFLRWRLSWRPMAWLGTLSYSMYLFHFIAIDLCALLLPAGARREAGAFVAFFAAVLLVSTAMATASHATLERWSARAARALVARLQQRRTLRAPA